MSESKTPILLTTLNARYMHCAFALRYLYANLGDLKSETKLVEFTIQQRPIDIVERLLSHQPKIIGFSVYIWNVAETGEVIALLKQVSPKIKIILGGPEVSFANDLPPLADLADYIITGAGEKTFPSLCRQLLLETKPVDLPDEKIITGEIVSLGELKLPYVYYNDEDIRNRLIYVEASRGCPFKCEFCLSSLDKTSVPFELSDFLAEMDDLHQRGARNFKFIDRTFNLKVATSISILEFFLAQMSDDLYLHFEVIPDNLPEKLKAILLRFPKNSLQFEIGIQTFDTDIQRLISRKQNNAKTAENLQWLRENTGAHIHADLIFGLPEDTLENFANSFDQLIALAPQEIQVGILKRLRGAPINRHSDWYQLRYNPNPPYNILSTRDISFATMQRVNRFARFWDMIGNSGRYRQTLPLILGDHPFQRFLLLSDKLYEATGSTWQLSLPRVFKLLYKILVSEFKIEANIAKQSLMSDYQRAGQKSVLNLDASIEPIAKIGKANKRQRQHL